jgi:hypothetical protein
MALAHDEEETDQEVRGQITALKGQTREDN